MIFNSGFLAVCILVLIHLYANQSKMMGWIWRGQFLSFAAGISFAYVFVDLLPALEKGQPVLKRTFGEVIPYFDKHAYLIALIGFLFYYGLDKHSRSDSKLNFWFPLAGYLIFNFFVGASLSDSANPETQPLILFTIALGMHYFVRDHNAEMGNPKLYQTQARWWLAGFLVAGYVIGYLTHIPNAIVAIAVSFLAGGIFLNVLHYELPKREQPGYFCFVMGSLIYTAIVLGLGD